MERGTSTAVISLKMWSPDLNMGLGTVAELVERGPRMEEISSLIPGQVKSMTYKIYTYHFLAWRSALIV